MSPFGVFRDTIEAALGIYGWRLGLGDGDPSCGEDCLCHRCVFVRGVRGELAAFAKAEAKAEKKRAK
jgi:hypothetical protein